MTDGIKSYLKQYISKGMGRLLDQLLPPRCLSCGVGAQDTGLICPECWKGLNFLQGPACLCCGYPFDFDHEAEGSLCAACQAKQPAFDRARAAVRYDDGSRQMIISFKHNDRTDYADFFSLLLMQASHSLKLSDAIVVPVPLHKKRLGKRRYNQAALLGRKFAEKKGFDYRADMLIREKHTPPQEGNYGRRKRNVAGAFSVRNKYQDIIRNKVIVLIDDVYTTGATVRACSHILKRAGAGRVEIMTVARVCKPAVLR